MQADDGFLEAVLQFVVALPLADVWQDAAWREQQRRLLTAQFGPREVAALGAATHSALAGGAADASAAGSSPLAWVQARPPQACTTLLCGHLQVRSMPSSRELHVLPASVAACMVAFQNTSVEFSAVGAAVLDAGNA